MAPLPSPGNIIRVHMRTGPSDANQWGSRFYLKYTGGPPTGADLSTLCSNVEAHYAATINAQVSSSMFLTEILAVDLSSDTGNEGSWTGSLAGGNSGESAPEDASMQVNFDIARRYRGGKPKIFLPPAAAADIESENTWSSALVTAINTAWGTFMSDILADTYSSFALTDNVNVSFYSGFTVFITPSGRARNIPKVRPVPIVDNITGHAMRALIASQRRRRTAFTG